MIVVRGRRQAEGMEDRYGRNYVFLYASRPPTTLRNTTPRGGADAAGDDGAVGGDAQLRVEGGRGDARAAPDARISTLNGVRATAMRRGSRSGAARARWLRAGRRRRTVKAARRRPPRNPSVLGTRRQLFTGWRRIWSARSTAAGEFRASRARMIARRARVAARGNATPTRRPQARRLPASAALMLPPARCFPRGRRLSCSGSTSGTGALRRSSTRRARRAGRPTASSRCRSNVLRLAHATTKRRRERLSDRLDLRARREMLEGARTSPRRTRLHPVPRHESLGERRRCTERMLPFLNEGGFYATCERNEAIAGRGGSSTAAERGPAAPTYAPLHVCGVAPRSTT